jgi:CLIP1 zinc knuckle
MNDESPFPLSDDDVEQLKAEFMAADPKVEIVVDEEHLAEPYCDYCERYGHTFSSCPKRDDETVPDEEL